MGLIKQNESEPLAYGFVEDRILYKKVKYPFTGEFCFYNTVGKDLVNFAWLDSDLIADSLLVVWGIYVKAKHQKEDYAFLVSVILDRCSKLFTANSFFALYLLSYVDFLLESNIDMLMLSPFSDIGSEVISDFLKLQTVEPLEFNDLQKRESIPVFQNAIEEKQKLVIGTLEDILLQKKNDCMLPIERYYAYENESEAFRAFWHSDFMVKLGKRTETQKEVVLLTVLNTIDDVLRYELMQMLTQGIEYKVCKNCGKLFVPSGRSDSLYCDRLMPGQEKPCNLIGANLIAKKKLDENPALKLYRSAYQRLNKRVEYEYMTKEDFEIWKVPALEKREQCINGVLSFDAYEAWINETSRQR